MTVQETVKDYIQSIGKDVEGETVAELIDSLSREELSDVIYSMAQDLKNE